jgi:hypothetical protein
VIALALLVAAAQPAGPQAYPAAEVLAAFGDVCRDLKDLERTKARALSAGWAAFTPEPSTPIGQLVEFGMSQGRKMATAQGGSITPMRVLRRNVAGEELVAVLSGVRMEGSAVNGCRVYDVGETREIKAAEAEAWIGRPPARSASDAVISIAAWEPGYEADHDSFELFFVPSGSPAIQLVKVSGVALKADFVGGQE